MLRQWNMSLWSFAPSEQEGPQALPRTIPTQPHSTTHGRLALEVWNYYQLLIPSELL